jgi:hypothetical protein
MTLKPGTRCECADGSHEPSAEHLSDSNAHYHGGPCQRDAVRMVWTSKMGRRGHEVAVILPMCEPCAAFHEAKGGCAMSLADRIALEPCGCHTDKPTGIVTSYCLDHQPCAECGATGVRWCNAAGHWICDKCAGKHEARAYQPKTGERCGCRPGMERDNCPRCEGTGWIIDFKAIRSRRANR